MDKLKQARNRMSAAFNKGMREGDGWLPESFAPVNSAASNLIAAVKERHGEAWLVYVNPPNKDVTKVLVKADGDNEFGASFVVGVRDAELERLLVERLQTPYTTTDADAELIDGIFKRADEIGALKLFWS